MHARWMVALLCLGAAGSAQAVEAHLLALAESAPLEAADRAAHGRYQGWLVAQAPDYDVVKTRDGKVHVGKVMRETGRGYLFRSVEGKSYVIDFKDIDDIESTNPALKVPPKADPAPKSQGAPPPSAPPASPPPSKAAPAPEAAQPAPPPPPPAASSPAPEPRPSLEPTPAPSRSARLTASERREMEEELAELRASNPSLVLPLVLTIGGGAAFVLSLALIEVFTGDAVLLWTVLFFGGLAAAVVGAILLVKAILKRSRRPGRIRELERALGVEPEAPPPAAPLPGVRFDPTEGGRPLVTVAVF